jgi:phage recombination protein Bet
MASKSKAVAKAQDGQQPGGAVVPARKQAGLVYAMASKYGIEPDKMMQTLKATAFRQRSKNGVPAEITNEQMMALMLVSQEYDLNPFLKQIYAFPQDGGIVPVVGIDGWIRIINRQTQLDWMELEFAEADPGEIPEWAECVIKRKDREKPIRVREYFCEVKRNTDPWAQMPRRMLRHKAIKECARVAFGLSGIYDPDEADYMINTIDVTPAKPKPTTEPPKQIAAEEPSFATAEQIAEIRGALEKKDMDEEAVLEEWKLAAIEELEFDAVPEVLSWIAHQHAD